MGIYGTWTATAQGTDIPNIQSVTISVGRQNPADPWPISTAEIVAWYPTGYASPISALKIGKTMRIDAPNRGRPTWHGNIKDVTVDVDIPWNSGTSTGNGDFVRISCEGYAAALGREEQIVFNYAGIPTETPFGILTDLTTGAHGYTYNYVIEWTNNSGWDKDSENRWDPPDTCTFQPWELMQQIAILTETKLCDGMVKGSNTSSILLSDPGLQDNQSTANWKRIAPTSFSDTTNDATHRIYDSLTFDSLSDNYYTQATINDRQSDHTASIGSSPYRTFYSQGPEQQASPAFGSNYDEQATRYANMFSKPEIAISSISATTANQQTQNLDTLDLLDDDGGAITLGALPIHCVNVTFRGTTYLCQIEGVTVTADVAQTRYTYYVSPAAMTNFFRLNNSSFGVLDTNRLARYSN